ncbi:MAG TPA: S53 family peptidase [Streptosporangiaceae bacterium]|nr:S53 family peptidase [Streptosporangiaceae bacterium]
MLRFLLRRAARPAAVLATCGAAVVAGAPAGSVALTAGSLPVPVPAISDYQFLSAGTTPPAESDCLAAGRRCFTAAAMENSYNLPSLYAGGNEGQGVTIAIIDSFGNPNMAADLANFDTQMGLPHMCGEPGQACGTDVPAFQHLYWNGKTEVKSPPPGSHSPGNQDRTAWTLETSLDVEWAHAIAPLANIIDITTNPAETQGVQGFPAMMDAEQFVVDTHQATVISQSFGAVEEGFNGTQAMLNLRHAFVSAAASGVTVMASSGDGGTANTVKTPVKNPSTVPYPTVNWPAADPLVTAVGGTYLCTNPVTGSGVDSTDVPAACQANPGVREVGWIDSGGGFSHVFAKPGYQDTLPAGSTPIGDMRGVPDVAFQASSRTGPLVYDTAPGAGGWFIVGGTSCSAPEFSGLVAIADQMAGHGLGQINPTLYKLAVSPAHANYFYDVTTGNNQADPSIPGYPATAGWDPVTGLGTPNAAALVPALAAG